MFNGTKDKKRKTIVGFTSFGATILTVYFFYVIYVNDFIPSDFYGDGFEYFAYLYENNIDFMAIFWAQLIGALFFNLIGNAIFTKKKKVKK